ncbi:MAG: DUF1553 domain-containing protein, partial [Planctomycetales bacterium]|nr:DUF1553 domain-containing protein [Planctomycetales bacterium]
MYRDWVVRSFNEDLSYDRFVIEQIAGDMLPDAGQDQYVATGFLRNSMVNEEGGIDPEQFRMEAMFDRMDAIGKSVLGLTLQCAQCHSHKYDPISQTDYYRLLAALNNFDEATISTFTADQRLQWDAASALIGEIEATLKRTHPDWKARLAAWEEQTRDWKSADWEILRPELDGSGGQKNYLLDDGSVLARGFNPAVQTTAFASSPTRRVVGAVRLELLMHPELPRGGPGRSTEGVAALTEFEILVETPATDGKPASQRSLPIATATADVNPRRRPLDPQFDDRSGRARFTGPIAYAIDGDQTTGWTTDIGPGRSNVPREAVFALAEPVELGPHDKLTVRLAQQHGGWNSDDNQAQNLGRFRLAACASTDVVADQTPRLVRQIIAKDQDERTAEDRNALFSYWRTLDDAAVDADWREANRRIEGLWQSHPRMPSQLAALERRVPRKTFRLERGDFLKPQEEVVAGPPAFLHSPQNPGEFDRLALARWLVDRRSPTAARSIVNRIWQAYFGIGLVRTSDDLGTQAERPTHPPLLDWLAVELMDHDWSLKHIHRLIVSSAAYQQSSVVSDELYQRDPENRLLARGPRFRVDAETVRDIALSASGLLNPALGGPSVYPPAPKFLFEPPVAYGPRTWDYDLGPDKYRRAIYTFRFRSTPYPALGVFDAPQGSVACVRRSRSNTPLQALTTLNEELFMECAGSLADAVLPLEDDEARLAAMARRCLARDMDATETRLLADFVKQQRDRLVDERAVWTATARVMLNLDETVTKQ